MERFEPGVSEVHIGHPAGVCRTDPNGRFVLYTSALEELEESKERERIVRVQLLAAIQAVEGEAKRLRDCMKNMAAELFEGKDPVTIGQDLFYRSDIVPGLPAGGGDASESRTQQGLGPTDVAGGGVDDGSAPETSEPNISPDPAVCLRDRSKRDGDESRKEALNSQVPKNSPSPSTSEEG